MEPKKQSDFIKEDLELIEKEITRLQIELREANGAYKALYAEHTRRLAQENVGKVLRSIKDSIRAKEVIKC